MSTAVRKQAPRIARPAARYWRGKAPKGVADVGSDSEEDEQDEQEQEEYEDMPLGAVEGEDDEGGEEGATGKESMNYKPGKTLNIALKDVNIREGKVIVAGREESGKTIMEGRC